MQIERIALVGATARLEPMTRDHVDGLLAAANENRAAYGYTEVPSEPAVMRAHVERLIGLRELGTDVPLTTCSAVDGRVLGATRFLWLRHYFGRSEPDAVEIGGTWLAASAQRTGINTEAKLLMLTHAFETWGVQRVDLKTDARNDRSRAAIERIGGQLDGIMRAWQPSLVPGEEGQPRDTAMYSIIASEWPEIRNRFSEQLGHRAAGELPG